MKFWAGGILVLLIAGALGWWYFASSPQEPARIVRDSSPFAVRADSHEGILAESEGGPVTTSLSLPAFARQEFNGRDFKVGRVLEENSAYTRYYITYQSGDLTISGIMNVPKGEGSFPLLMLNHGFIDPAVYTNGRGLKREQDYLARRGYVVIHSDYRNHAESDDALGVDERFRVGYAEDVINAIKAVQAARLSYIDAERIGMLGHSMGGGVAWVIATTQPELVDAYVLFAPVSADVRDNFNKWIKSRPEVAQAIIAEHGSPEENPEFWDGISPQTFFSNIQEPIMIHHGASDESVPLEWSERSARALEAAGKDTTLHVYPNEPHEFIDAWPTVMKRTLDFFDERVKE